MLLPHRSQPGKPSPAHRLCGLPEQKEGNVRLRHYHGRLPRHGEGGQVTVTHSHGRDGECSDLRKLKAVLERGRASQVDFSSYIAMSYDNPWKIMNRRNDVMYKKL